MSIEEIMERLAGIASQEKSIQKMCDDRWRRARVRKNGSAIRAAIALLKTHPEAQPNEPHSRPTDFHVNDDMFGTHVKIPTGASGDLHVYKVIGRIESNGYCDTPIMGGSNSVWHEEIVPVLNVVHCGVSEDTIVRVALSDCEIIQQPNEPLTLEELQDMAGLPVWVESPGVDWEISGRWVIVGGAIPEEEVIFCNGDFNCWDYGRVWIAYRRPPKEDLM